MNKLLVFLALVTVVAPNTRPGKNMLFLVDQSGSMDGGKTSDALQQFVNFASQPIDAGSICVYKFGKYPVKWGHKWQPLPSKEAIDRANEFLHGTVVDNQFDAYTKITPALVAALREPKKEMTIVLITDGQFDEQDDEVIKVINKWQQWRIKNGYGRAVIGCVGVGGRDGTLKLIAQRQDGVGYYSVEKKKKEPVCGPR